MQFQQEFIYIHIIPLSLFIVDDVSLHMAFRVGYLTFSLLFVIVSLLHIYLSITPEVWNTID
jgi:hypothetical protein